jgi:ADP-heptose:LPS heptosyltransferase
MAKRNTGAAGRRVAIFVQQGLGDVVLALPAIQRIRDHFAGEAILVVKSDLERQLIEIVFPELSTSTLVASKFGDHPVMRWGRVAFALRRARISDVAGLHLRDTIGAKFVVRLAGASRIEFNTFDVDDGRHKTVHYALLADRITGEAGSSGQFHLGEGDGPEQVSIKRDVVLAPGSGALEAHKRWPAMRYGELIELLHARDASTTFVLLGSPGERPLLQSIAEVGRAAGASVRIVAPGTLRESLTALTAAKVVIGGCSGSLHLAALANVPIIGIYGPTNPGWTGPVSSVVRIVRGDLTCAPCYALDFIGGCGNAKCMSVVSATSVLAALESIEGEPMGNALPWYPLSRLRTATATAGHGDDQ